MLKTRKNQKGFTLTELIIVIVIIGILAAVLIPTLSSYVTRAKKSAAEQNAYTMYQEWVGELEDEEELAELLVGKFYVQTNGYYVLIEDGAVKGSQKDGGDPHDYKDAFDAAFNTNETSVEYSALGHGDKSDLEVYNNLVNQNIALKERSNPGTSESKYIAKLVKTEKSA